MIFCSCSFFAYFDIILNVIFFLSSLLPTPLASPQASKSHTDLRETQSPASQSPAAPTPKSCQEWTAPTESRWQAQTPTLSYRAVLSKARIRFSETAELAETELETAALQEISA